MLDYRTKHLQHLVIYTFESRLVFCAAMAAPTQVKTVTVDNGIDVFYREAVPASSKDDSALPVVLLLHGFPSSSFQYRDLIPRLAHKYRVIAPDLPGYGFTVVPEARKYEYTFASITNTIISFLDALKIAKFAVYVFDYGAPTAFRLVAPIHSRRAYTEHTTDSHSGAPRRSQLSSRKTEMPMWRAWAHPSGRPSRTRGPTPLRRR